MEKAKKGLDSTKKHDSKSKSKLPDYSKELVSQNEVQYLASCTRFRLSTEYELSICNCKHILRLTIGERHSVVNPQKWLCNVCFTTESVWACLSCPNVACGRYIHEHALNHYLETHHPLVIDVNELYVYCYECEEYVLNDNKSGDIKVLRETLQAIRYQNFTGTTRSGHTLRTATISADEDVQMRRRLQQQQLDRDDRNFTAIWHSRFVRQRKIFRRWLHYVRHKNDYCGAEKDETTPAATDNSDTHSTSMPSLAVDDTSNPVEKNNIIKEDNAIKKFSADVTLDPIASNLEDGANNELPTVIPILLQPEVAGKSHEHSIKLSHRNEPISESLLPTSLQINKTLVIDNTPTEPQPSIDLGEAVPDANKQENCQINSFTNEATITHLTEDVIKEQPNACSSTTKFESCSSSVKIESTSNRNVDIVLPKNNEPLNANDSDTVTETSCNAQPVVSSMPTYCQNISQLPKDHGQNLEQNETLNRFASENNETINSCKGQRRSKRVNAASRYKEIMTRLSPSIISNEPLQKKMCMPDHDHLTRSTLKNISQAPKRRSLRLSLRLLETRKSKTAEEARHKKKMKKNKIKASNSSISKKATKRKKIERRLPSRTLPNRRTRMRSVAKSLYDSIPNRAVTSLIPGVTGLRNLGNTCYLNSIIQVLGHLQKFRRCLLAVRDLEIEDHFLLSDDSKPTASKVSLGNRRSTIEMYENQTSASRRFLKMQAGLNGGRESRGGECGKEDSSTYSPKRLYSNNSSPNSLSLCHELHDLYHIMWSGKWKLVSPYHFLSSVWQLIPSFRGYTQQDAQEFLCELLDKIVSELERRRRSQANKVERLAARISRVVHAVFEGRLHSQVRCMECNYISSTYEAFWDLSLEFPQRYHSATSNSWKTSNQGCTLMEMLDKFTEAERLDGGRVYSCSQCNGMHLPKSEDAARRRRLSNRKPTQKLSEAEKQIKIIELPQILRFHLKRFRWSGRNNREKIIVPVNFPSELDMKPHCWLDCNNSCDDNTGYVYDLSAVVIHHGRGFGSGHYTAYCWNDIGKFWVHCNDSHLELCSIDDVMASQAYILFYSQRGLDPYPQLFTPPLTPDLSPTLIPEAMLNPNEKTPEEVFEEYSDG